MTTSPQDNPTAVGDASPEAAPTAPPDAAPVADDLATAPPDAVAPASARRRLALALLGLGVVTVALGAFWYAGGFRLDGATGGTAAEAEWPVAEVPDKSPFRGARLIPEQPAPDFTLAGDTGQPFQLKDSRGKVVLVFFGYTSCPDVCPMTLAKIGAGLQALGPDADKVQAVFISVDPDRDTPEAMRRYLAGFDPRIVGVTGDDAALKAVAADYGVRFFKEYAEGLDKAGAPDGSATTSSTPESGADSAGTAAPAAASPDAEHADHDADHTHPGADDYTMAHSSTVFVIDPQGQLRTTFFEPYSPDDIAHDVRFLLEESNG